MSSCLAPSPIGQFLEEAPRKVLIPSRVQGSGWLGGFPGMILGCAGEECFLGKMITSGLLRVKSGRGCCP